MRIELGFSHESYLESLSNLDEEFYVTGGRDVGEPEEDYREMTGKPVPDNVHYGDVSDPDVVVQKGERSDVKITHNRRTQPLKGGWTVYTTERKIGRSPPPNKKWILIRHGIDTEEFKGWKGNIDGPVITTGNNILGRKRAFSQKAYKKLVDSDLEFKAFGRKNKDGFVSRDTLISELQNSSVYVNVSKTIIPHSLLEAMSVGVPVVTVPSVGNTDAVATGFNGIVAIPDKVVEATKHLKSNPISKIHGEKARETIIGRCSIEEFVSRWGVLLSQFEGGSK